MLPEEGPSVCKVAPSLPHPRTHHDESQQEWEHCGTHLRPQLALGSCQCHWDTARATGQLCHQEISSGRWECHCLACLGGTRSITIHRAGQGQG